MRIRFNLKRTKRSLQLLLILLWWAGCTYYVIFLLTRVEEDDKVPGLYSKGDLEDIGLSNELATQYFWEIKAMTGKSQRIDSSKVVEKVSSNQSVETSKADDSVLPNMQRNVQVNLSDAARVSTYHKAAVLITTATNITDTKSRNEDQQYGYVTNTEIRSLRHEHTLLRGSRFWRTLPRGWPDFELYESKPVVTIRGLESSGTNWLRELLNRNCALEFNAPSSSYDMDGIYGWKHYFLDEPELGQISRHKSHFVVVIVRGVFSWLSSVYKMAAFSALEGFQQPKFFEEFLTMRRSMSCTKMTSYYTNCKGDMWDHEDILQVRKHLLQNWLLAKRRLGNQVVFVKYEKLRDQTENTFNRDILRYFDGNIQCNSTFIPVDAWMKYHERIETFSRNKAEKGVCKSIVNPVIFESIKSRLDLDLESRILGYSYPETFEEFQKMRCGVKT